ncbi:MAG: DPP IV N-terminal domain-containing protein [Muribaculaceae bacterium]|nr:DPP IV N-terminal domain-containing protein [Muribaculaceae bacterium]
MTLRQLSSATLISLAAAAFAAPATSSRTLVSELEKYTAPASTPDKPAQYTYMPDGNSVAMLSDDCRKIQLSDIESGKPGDVLFDVANTREAQLASIEGFTLSPDGSKILVWTDSKPVYRRSSVARYYVYEVRSRILRPLSRETELQRAPVFSPNSRMVAFVDPATNNIRIAKLDYGSEVAVTTDGAPNEIINGVPDWTYEEEFATVCSMAWAPDNLSLCYLRYDERQVPAYSLTIYEGACDPRKEYALYPGRFDYKYPVAGKPNSKVTLHSYHIETRKIKNIELPASSVEYIPRIAYGPDASTLAVTTLNRDQNRLEIFRANPGSGVVKSLYVDTSKAWIPEEAYSDIVYDADGFTVGTLAPGYFTYRTISWQGMPMTETGLPDADATAYYGKDASGTRYFQAAAPTPADRSIYSIDAKGRLRRISEGEAGTSSAVFSPSMAYATISRSDVDTPPVHTLCKTAAGALKTLRTLENNASYLGRIPRTAVKKEFFTIPASGSTPELRAYIVKPADFDPSRRYPVVMSQYSGPGSQSVLNRWALDWEQYFASQGIVVVCADGRGTGGRGAEFMQCVYRRLGQLETADQTAAARWVASQSWADPAHIGIYGWSYGGYEALMCATQGASTPFAAAVAVAPVTSWRFYDTVYAERYMLTPGQNADGYDAGAPLLRAADLSCPLLLMYGTADDNVHPANSLEFVARLQHEGLMCEMFVFPNMNHSINGCRARALVWARMFDFFSRNLK